MNKAIQIMEQFGTIDFILIPIVLIFAGFNVFSKFDAATRGYGDFTSVGIAVIGGVVMMISLSFLLDIPESTINLGNKEVPPNEPPIKVLESMGGALSVIGSLAVVIFAVITGIVIYFQDSKKEISDLITDSKKNVIDKRFFHLRNKSEKLAQNCDKEGIKDLSFIKLYTATGKLIELLNKNSKYLENSNVKKFISGKIDLYLKFLNQYEAIMGHFDEEKRGTVEEGITNMIAGVEDVSNGIINDRYLDIEVNSDVIKQISK